MDNLFNVLVDAEKKNYIVGAATHATGTDRTTNHCGIYNSHAYAFLAAFTLKNEELEEDVILVRNPWGRTEYTGEWSYTDKRWTPELVAQIPLGVNPFETKVDGVFVMPKSSMSEEFGQACFAKVYVGHTRDFDSYKDAWYDALDADDSTINFYFVPP